MDNVKWYTMGPVEECRCFLAGVTEGLRLALVNNVVHTD